MKKSYFGTIVFAAACTVAAIASATANVCVTESRGISFVGFQDDVNAATNEALNSCQQVSFTVNSECSSALRCGWDIQNPYPSGNVTCVASSNNVGFQSIGSVAQIVNVINSLVSRCQSASFTVNSQCSSSVQCGDTNAMMVPYPSGRVSCSTSSHGLNFQTNGEANDVAAVANNVATQCQQNSVTVNAECTGNVRCQDASNLPPPGYGDDIVCRTTSHDIPFEARGPQSDINNLTSSVISQCQQNPVTVNTECTQNVHCEPAFR